MTDAERLAEIEGQLEIWRRHGVHRQRTQKTAWLIDRVRSLEAELEGTRGLLGNVLEESGHGRLEVVRRAAAEECRTIIDSRWQTVSGWLADTANMSLDRSYRAICAELAIVEQEIIDKFGLDAKEQQP